MAVYVEQVVAEADRDWLNAGVDPDVAPHVASTAVSALATTGATPLRSLLTHPQPDVRASAVGHLAETGDHHDLARMRALMTDPEPNVRSAAVRALARLYRRVHGSPRSLQPGHGVAVGG